MLRTLGTFKHSQNDSMEQSLIPKKELLPIPPFLTCPETSSSNDFSFPPFFLADFLKRPKNTCSSNLS